MSYIYNYQYLFKMSKQIIILILTLTLFGCGQSNKSTIEKENELLKRENEVLKREKELKDKPQQAEKPISIQKVRSDNWKTFNHKYGFSIDLPNYFSEGSLTASGIQYYITDIDPEISLGIETIGEASQTSLIKDYQTYLNSTDGIDYKVLRDNFFVISGQNIEGIYYYKMFIKNNRKYFLMLTYPQTQKDLFDNLLPRISKSLK